MDAAIPVIAHQNPLYLISELEIDCINDATALMPENEKEKNPAGKPDLNFFLSVIKYINLDIVNQA